MRTRPREVLTGLVAIAVLAGIIVGLPVLLYRLGGSPLPRHLVGWHRLATILSSRDDGAIFLAATRDCSWLAWLTFSASVAAEAGAAVRGHGGARFRQAGFQGLAARLVALAALTVTAPPALTLTASAVVVSAQHAASLPMPEPGPPEASPAVIAGPAAAATPAMPAVSVAEAGTAIRVVAVRSGDCLWSIAQRYLGSGDRYPEIARLNYGRDVGDGQIFINPSLIEPGWRLLIPAGGSPAGQASSDSDTAAGLPADRDVPSSHVGHASRPFRHASRHIGHATPDSHYRRRHPTAGDVTWTGLADNSKPSRQRPAASSSGEAGSPSSGQGASASPTRAAPDDNRASISAAGSSATDAATGNPLAEAGAFVAGALAGSTVTYLDAFRRRQRLERRAGRRIALPADPAVLAVEHRLRASAPAETPGTLRDGLACLEASIIRAGQALPDIVGLHVTPDMIEVLLAAPAADSPPAPFRVSPGRQGMCWQLDASALGEQARSGCHLLPGLFTAGATADGFLLLDLEALQVTGCDGPPDLVDRVITTVAAELATGQWAGWYDLILVGCDELGAVGRAEHASTLDEALTLIEARRAGTRRRLACSQQSDVRQLRLAEPDDEDWALTIVVSRIEPSPGQLQRLIDLAEDGAGGVAALLAGDAETASGRMAPTVLQLAPDPAEPRQIVAGIVPLQITVRPRALSPADYYAISTLFRVAADTADVSTGDAAYARFTASHWIPPYAVGADESLPTDQLPWEQDWREHPVEEELPDEKSRWEQDRREHPLDEQLPGGESPSEHLLEHRPAEHWPSGPLHSELPLDQRVRPDSLAQSGLASRGAGPRHAFASPLQVKVLGPFITTGAEEQLQPKQAELVLALALSAPAGLSNSALCTLLGPDPDHPKPPDAVRQVISRARRRLGLASDGQEYIVHTGNGNYMLHADATLDWTEFRALVAAGGAEALRAAVALIRGEPFTGSYFWWIDVPLLETVRAELVDAATALAEIELDAGSPRAAARAARAGLRAETCAEQLWRMLMRAEYAAGNLAGVGEAWRGCLDAIGDVSPGGEPHPDTEALFHQLTLSASDHVPASGHVPPSGHATARDNATARGNGTARDNSTARGHATTHGPVPGHWPARSQRD